MKILSETIILTKAKVFFRVFYVLYASDVWKVADMKGWITFKY